jgi:hypothetical protein
VINGEAHAFDGAERSECLGNGLELDLCHGG